MWTALPEQQPESFANSKKAGVQVAIGDNSGWTVAIRSRVTFVILLLFILSANAFAGDYTVAYALDIGGKIETGKIDNCEYAKQCVIASKDFGLSVTTYFIYPEDREVSVTVYGKPGCCYFTDGKESRSFDSRQPIPSMAIFEGHARRRNEFVQNYRLGTLYLRLLNLQ
jgi:hypothetical protein